MTTMFVLFTATIIQRISSLQLIRTTTVIDFEESRMGDPAFDLGYFIAQMKMSNGFGRSIFRRCRYISSQVYSKIMLFRR